jgi:hypothetical protein
MTLRIPRYLDNVLRFGGEFVRIKSRPPYTPTHEESWFISVGGGVNPTAISA